MSDNTRFPFYANYWRSIRRIRQATKRERFFSAVCAYVFDGEEPDFGGDDELEGRWDLIQSSLDASVAAVQAGSRGGSAKAPSAATAKAPSVEPAKAPSEVTAKAPSEDAAKAPSGEKDKQLRTKNLELRTKNQEKESEKGKGPRSGRPDPRTAEVREVIDYLNAKTGRQFRPVDANARHVRARLAEGYTVADCERVVDIMAGKWLGEESDDGRDMGQYLRPETLFGPKFDGYLNSGPTSPGPSGPRVSFITGEGLEDERPQVKWGDAL